jgi:hypothetical protein
MYVPAVYNGTAYFAPCAVTKVVESSLNLVEDDARRFLSPRISTGGNTGLTFTKLGSVTRIRMTLASQKQATQNPDHAWLALRVACRTCGGRRLDHVQQNLLECSDCHTKQWRTLNLHEHQPSLQPDSPGIVKRLMIRLGFPQRAFIQYIPKATQFFWFRCMECKKTSTDYLHGYSRYFICQFCQSEIRSL